MAHFMVYHKIKIPLTIPSFLISQNIIFDVPTHSWSPRCRHSASFSLLSRHHMKTWREHNKFSWEYTKLPSIAFSFIASSWIATYTDNITSLHTRVVPREFRFFQLRGPGISHNLNLHATTIKIIKE
uniref:Uncharacterized protein n=1 Tax=Arundo donax TaxID=35708 RepID=A0A0A9EJ65_ARUDO